MDVEYKPIEFQKFKTYILVPSEWPTRARDVYLILAEQIIAKFQYASPVVQINNLPTRLICCVNDSGFYYVFQKVNQEDMIGVLIYNIFVPQSGNVIRVEITSGIHVNHSSQLNDVTRIQPDIHQYYGNIRSATHGMTLGVIRRRLWNKRVDQRRRRCSVCGRVIDKRETL